MAKSTGRYWEQVFKVLVQSTDYRYCLLVISYYYLVNIVLSFSMNLKWEELYDNQKCIVLFTFLEAFIDNSVQTALFDLTLLNQPPLNYHPYHVNIFNTGHISRITNTDQVIR